MRSAAIALVLLVSLHDSRPVEAATNCPVNTMSVTNKRSTSTDPSSSLSESHNCVFLGGSAQSSCRYDLGVGTLSASATAYQVECGADAAVTAHDTYVLNGPDTTVVWAFLAKLSVSGGSQSGGAGGDISFDGVNGFGTLAGGTASLPVTRRAGQSFDLFLRVHADAPNGPASGSAFGALFFDGLPPGYSIVSCQGYTTSVPVPVARTTWGRLKQSYR